jgi:hypothetical protein
MRIRRTIALDGAFLSGIRPPRFETCSARNRFSVTRLKARAVICCVRQLSLEHALNAQILAPVFLQALSMTNE